MKLILLILGIVMILVGLVLLPLPIPLGLIFIFIGIVLVVGNNKRARKLLRSARARWGWLDSFFHKAGKIIPGKFSKEIERTDPNGHDDDEEEDDDEEDEEDDGNDHPNRQHTSSPSSGLTRKPMPPRYRPSSRPRR